MKNTLLILGIISCLYNGSFAQKETNWSITDQFLNSEFIENKGQFSTEEQEAVHEKIFYYARKGKLKLYFSSNALVFRYDSIYRNENDKLKNEQDEDEKSANEEEENEGNISTMPLFMKMKWQGANPDAKIEVQEAVSNYYTYVNPTDKTGGSGIIAHAWKKLIYHNMYNNIDVEFYFPETGSINGEKNAAQPDRQGIKYNIILHPGANPSDLKMNYSENARLFLTNKNISILSPCGNFTDHAPVAYFEDGEPVSSSFELNGNTVSFKLAILHGESSGQNLIIDPWITSTKFAPLNKAYDIAYDLQGNVYAYGGAYPFQESKYNSGGSLQWTFTTNFSNTYLNMGTFYGDLEVDKRSGSSYLIEGYHGGPNSSGAGSPGATVLKLNTGGTQISMFKGDSSMNEMWRCEFDYCDNILVIGGGNVGYQPNYYNAAILDSSCKSINLKNVMYKNILKTYDITLLSIPIDIGGISYMATSKSSTFNATYDNCFLQAPLPALTPTPYILPDNHNFIELGVNGLKNTPTYYQELIYNQNVGNGFNGMASNATMLLTYDGATLRKWRPSGTAAGSITIGTIPFMWGGIDIDCQGNIYAGYLKSIRVYDSTLKFIGSIPLKDTVYDLNLGVNWNVYTCGKGFVESDRMLKIPVMKEISTTQKSASNCKSFDGTAHAVADFCGGVPPYTYTWSNGQTGQTATGLGPGSYTVTARDASACVPKQDTAIIHILGPASSFTGVPSQTNMLCFGDNSGTAIVTVTGGTPPIIYSWNNGSTSSTITGLAAGSYTCNISDNTPGGCDNNYIITITEPAPLKIQTVSSPVTCHGDCNGAASIVASGGTNPYIYSWSNNSTNTNISNLCANSYKITLTDLNKCKHDTTIVITDHPPITATSSMTPAICGQNNGSASVTVTSGSGTSPYTYLWNTKATTSKLTKLTAGNYTVIIKDAKGCKDTVPVTVPGGSAFSDTPSAVNVLCYGDHTGSVSVSTTGGTTPYSYSWSNGTTITGVTTASLTGLPAGTYICTIKDNSGSATCADALKIIITQPNELLIKPSFINPFCHGDCNGQATVIANGGVSPYTYSWSNNSTDANISTLCAGTYSLTLTDKNGCKRDSGFALTEPPAITFVPAFTPTTCGASNGSVSAVVSGGTPAYTYSWNNNSTVADLTNIPAGTYSLSVTDAKGCVNTTVVTVPNSAPFTMSASPARLRCFGDNNGSLTVTVNGNSSPYTYLWSNNQTTSSISDLTVGIYTVNVKDANGCVGALTDTVTQPSPLVLDQMNRTICKGDSAKLIVNVFGGTSPYSYMWNNFSGRKDSIFTPANTSSYHIAITDANGCKINKTDSIIVVPIPQAAFSGIDVCVGIPTVFKDSSSASGGSISSRIWSFGDGTNGDSPMHIYSKAGTYTVTLTVSNGLCHTTISHVVNVYPVPHADFSADPQPTTILNPTITFTDLSNGGVNGNWDLGDGTTDIYSPGINPVHTYSNENIPGGETYRVKLNIVNEHGCPDTISKLIHIDPEWTFYVPNTFTPNGDGKNDLFFGTGTGIIEKEMWIFDRWGNLIFHTKDLYGGWDGKVQAGNEINAGRLSNENAQEDTYVWLIMIKEVFMKTHRLIGHVNIVK